MGTSQQGFGEGPGPNGLDAQKSRNVKYTSLSPEGHHDRFPLSSDSTARCNRCRVATNMSVVCLVGNRVEVEDPGRRQLLAMPAVRRNLESGPAADQRLAMEETMNAAATSHDIDRAQIVRELHELIAALDRRVPQVHRVGELAIAQAAAALRSEALKRIDTLERESAAPRRTVAEV